ncbi:unnamed protein product [Rotaria sordida]|uniref:Uncharacterized protein n=1 Tax=Rotaria sordida TaxID=392033 RepID=A0A815EHE3_9BILA|nr:unnamed protein product [Rotaria sordida]CAF1314810.1 unnamed protein product [Rotaria sordida]CAF3864557.1 unnamed protein product [Rotaria sordida]CAF4112431.1 unnamed protein product [Rotaria sordida]
MKNSFRKSFSYRLRKKTHSDDHVYPRIDTNNCSNSKLNLVKPIKSKSFLQLRRRRRSSSSSLPPPLPPSSSSDQIKSTVFEPRYDIHDDPISSSINSHSHPFDRLTYQIRKSFRNTLRRQRSRLGSINSNKQLILNKNDENPLIYPIISTGLTSPLTIKIDDNNNNNNKKQRKAPLAPTHMNQSISLPIEMNVEKQQQQSCSISSNDQQLDDNNNKQNLKKTNFNRFFRINFSFLPKTQQQQQLENHNEKLTLRQRFDSLRRSFHILSTKHNGHLLSNE